MGNKSPVTLRIDEEIIAGFKALANATPGMKYQALMQYALEEYLKAQGENSVEARLTRIEKVLFKKK
jgi:hypothetical protein